MFLHDPHSTHRYYGELLRSYDGKIFNDSDHLLPYYVSAYALNTIEELFKTNALNAELRYMKYHMLMLFKIIITGNSIPHFNSREFNTNAASIMKVVSDISLALKCFARAQEYIKEIIKKHNVGYQTNRVKIITTELLKIAKCEC